MDLRRPARTMHTAGRGGGAARAGPPHRSARAQHSRTAGGELRSAWAGGPLIAINTRLSAGEVAYILEHSEVAVLVHDPVFDELVETATAQLANPPQRIRAGAGDEGEYESMLAAAEPMHLTPSGERSLLPINYTSGTTGRPKGVMYHHRGAYLQAPAMVGHTGLTPSAVYLRTLPMFHCNGWCFAWAVTAAAADTRLPAEGGPRGSMATHPRGGRHAPQRGPDGAVDDRVRERSGRRGTRRPDGADREGRVPAVTRDPAPQLTPPSPGRSHCAATTSCSAT